MDTVKYKDSSINGPLICIKDCQPVTKSTIVTCKKYYICPEWYCLKFDDDLVCITVTEDPLMALIYDRSNFVLLSEHRLIQIDKILT